MFDDIRRRVSTVPVGVDYSAQAISPDGRWLLASGDGNLYVYPLDAPVGGGGGRGGGAGGGSQSRQLTTSPGAKTNAQFTPDSREVFYLEGGRINVIAVETRQSRAIDVTAELDVDFASQKMEVFRQAWTYMRDGFYDEKFHGADWGEVRAQFAPIVAGVQTPDELRRVLNLMIGELNASHLGASGGASAAGPASNNGRLGLRSIAPSTSRPDACASPRCSRSARRPSPSRCRSATTCSPSTASRSAPGRTWTSS